MAAISSTGHMILVDEFIKLNVTEEFWNMFLVVIQLGAILAVCVLFIRDLLPFGFGKTRQECRSTWNLWGKIIVGCLPAAIVGIPLDDFMEEPPLQRLGRCRCAHRLRHRLHRDRALARQ